MTIGEVLAPLRARYATWVRMAEEQVRDDVADEDPQEVRAMQLVLRLERDAAPSRHTALALAASGCAALCLDPRSAPGGQWHEAVAAYCAGRIRKVTRRARGAPWEATADLPGLTLADGDTQVRVLVPGRVAELDKRVAKLQVGGTDLPPDEGRPGPAGAGPVLTCLVPDTLSLTVGKFMAQTGHAGMFAAALAARDDPETLRRWFEAGCPARVEDVDEAGWRELRETFRDPAAAWRERRLVAVRDAGFTEVDPGTVTVAARLG